MRLTVRLRCCDSVNLVTLDANGAPDRDIFPGLAN